MLAPAALAQTDAMPPETKAPEPMSMPAKPPVKPSSSLIVAYSGRATKLTLADLRALPQQTVTAVDGHTGKSDTFTGPLVADVLAKAGLPANDSSHKLILHGFLNATGTDDYYVVYSLAELEPLFSSGKAIIALTMDQAPVASGIELVNPLDVKPARWVHGLASLSVITTK